MLAEPKLSIRVLFVALIGAVTQSCATFTPQTITCETGGKVAVENFDQRVSALGFSVLPPSGGHWCIMSAGDSAVSFRTLPFLGEHVETAPTKEQDAHRFVVVAVSIKVKTSDITSQPALQSFMKRWLEVVQGYKIIGGDYYVRWSRDPHWEVIRSHVEMEDSPKADCVRYQLETEQRDASEFSNWTLTHVNEGIACRHPQSERVFVVVQFNEQRRKGYENPDARRRLRDQADVTIRSLEFTAL